VVGNRPVNGEKKKGIFPVGTEKGGESERDESVLKRGDERDLQRLWRIELVRGE